MQGPAPVPRPLCSPLRLPPQATVLCDLLLLHILPKRHYYKQKKFKYAEDMGPGPVRELPQSALQRLQACMSVLGNQLFPGG